jgi:hypothetical protein
LYRGSQPQLLAPLLHVVDRVIAGFLVKRAGFKLSRADTGVVTLIQRFGSAANLNIHLHCLVLDGVYLNCDGAAIFHEAAAPYTDELEVVLLKIITRTMRLLTRLGALIEEPERTYLAETDTDGALRALQAASCTYRIALGPRAGQKVLSLQSLPSAARASTPELRINARGFSLHAAVRWRADQRLELEQLCRYITRPAIANERLKRNRAGQVVLQLKSPTKTAPPISSWSRWSSCSGWSPWCRVRVYILSASMACSRPTRSCAVKSFPLRQSVPPSPRPITPLLRETPRA